MAIQALMTDETGKAIKDALASIQAAIQQQGQGGQGGGVSISVETDPEALTTLLQSVVYFLAPGTWTAFSPAVTVPAGKFGIAKYGTAWTVTVLGGGELASAIAAMTAADELAGDEVLPMGSGESVTVQQLAEFAEGVVGGNAAHATSETSDQAKLASVGKVQELIGSGMRVVPITSVPETLDQSVIYFVHDSSSDITFGTETVHAGATAYVYHDGNDWIVSALGGQSITIVNDITTGGANKALSAEMGKEIGKVINASTNTLTKGTGGAIVIANDGHYVNKNDGNINSSGDQFISNSFKLSGDSQVTIECAYAPAGSPISMVLPEGSTHPYKPISVTHTSSSNTHYYICKIYEGGDYVFSGNRSGKYNVTVEQASVRDSLGACEKTLNDNTAAIVQEHSIRSLMPSTDYSVNNGFIRTDGSIEESTSYQYTSHIFLKKYEKIEFASFTVASLGYISLTDENDSYHNPIITSSVGPAETDLISYIAEEDCYVALCASVNRLDATGANKSNVKVYSGNNQIAESIGVIAARQARREALYRAMPKYDDRTHVEIDAAIKVDDERAFGEARIERADALFEIKKLCPGYNFDPTDSSQDDTVKEHICHIEKDGTKHYLEGYCGYTEVEDDGGEITRTPTIFWHILDNGILYIHGYGKMYDFLKGTQKHINLTSAQGQTVDWYYGFVTNVNGYTNTFSPSTWKHNDSWNPVTYETPRVYMPQDYGDAINPFYEDSNTSYQYNGYAAPWYPYRKEINYEIDYEAFSSYKRNNPHLFTYNKVVIESDTGTTENPRPGITYIGMWAFYKCLVKNLVIPNTVETIAEWGIRYCDNMETIVMGNGVTKCEGMVVSRMTNLRHIKLSTSLTEIGDDCFGSGGNLLQRLDYPDTLTTIGRHSGENMKGLRSIHLPSAMTTIYANGVFLPDNAAVINIPEGVTTIASNGIHMSPDGDKGVILVLPSTLTSLITTGILYYKLDVVIYKTTSVGYSISPTYLVVPKNAQFNKATYTKIYSDNTYDYYYHGLIS